MWWTGCHCDWVGCVSSLGNKCVVQLTSLVTLGLVSRFGSSDPLEAPKYKCLVSLDFVKSISRSVLSLCSCSFVFLYITETQLFFTVYWEMNSSLQTTGWSLVWLIGAVVCPLAANRGSSCSFMRAMDGRIVRCRIISSCQWANQLPLPKL